MFAAVESAEVAQEDQHHGLVAPQVAEAYRGARRIRECHVRQHRNLHSRKVYAGCALVNRGNPARLRQARIASATIVSVGP